MFNKGVKRREKYQLLLNAVQRVYIRYKFAINSGGNCSRLPPHKFANASQTEGKELRKRIEAVQSGSTWSCGSHWPAIGNSCRVIMYLGSVCKFCLLPSCSCHCRAIRSLHHIGAIISYLVNNANYDTTSLTRLHLKRIYICAISRRYRLSRVYLGQSGLKDSNLFSILELFMRIRNRIC
mgnify:CR=1 FL=1